MTHEPLNHFTLTNASDGCEHYERADGYVIDWFRWPPNGGPCAVLVDVAGDVVGYYDSPEEAAAWANILTTEDRPFGRVPNQAVAR